MIIEASFGGVFRIIFYILLFSAIIRLVAYLATPYVVRKAEETLRDRMRGQQKPLRKEGEVTIEQKEASRKRDERGEFVDYEEIKD